MTDYATKLLTRELRGLWATRDALIWAAAKREDLTILHPPHHNDEIRSLARALRILRASQDPRNVAGDVWKHKGGAILRIVEVMLHRGVEHLVTRDLHGGPGETTEANLLKNGWRRTRRAERA